MLHSYRSEWYVNKYCCEPACYTVTAVNDLQGSCSWLCTMCLQIYPDIYCSFSKNNNILLQDFPSLFTRLPQFYIKFVILMLTTCVSNKKYLCFLQNCSFHRGRFFSATPCTVQKQRSCVITSCLLKPLSLPQCCSYKLSMWCFNFSLRGCYRSVECRMLGSLTVWVCRELQLDECCVKSAVLFDLRTSAYRFCSMSP